MNEIENESVVCVFASYPDTVRPKLMYLRQLILEVAEASSEIGELEETLKWGEPSYLAKGGSTIRIDWKATNPDRYAMYFNCNTNLVDTFKEFYSDVLHFEGNRAIVFQMTDSLPTDAIKHCVALALQYHKLKHLPLLGV